MVSPFDSKYISNTYVKSIINDLENTKKYLKNFGHPLNSLIKEGNSIKGILNILGFFRIPGSAQVNAKISMIQDYARVILRDLYNLNLDKQIGRLFELSLKLDAMYKYVKELEDENAKLRREKK